MPLTRYVLITTQKGRAMNVFVEVNGSLVELPADGREVFFRETGLRIRFAGFRELAIDGTRADLLKARAEQIISLVPDAPGYITVADLSKKITGVSEDTVRRVLHAARSAGRVESLRPKSSAPGNVARHWIRKE